MSTPCQVIKLGRIGYTEAWALQKRLVVARSTDQIPDTLLWVEHPHTYTLGSSGHAEYVLWSPEELAARGVEVRRVDRGGDVTYHGPGQLVGYPIIQLPLAEGNLHADVIAYIRNLEQSLIQALTVYGIAAWAYPGYTGVWVGESDAPAKIAAIGVKVTTRRVTLHGFALNVNTDLDYFTGIIPCGIADKPVTSMQALLGKTLNLQDISETINTAFGAIFDKTLSIVDADAIAQVL